MDDQMIIGEWNGLEGRRVSAEVGGRRKGLKWRRVSAEVGGRRWNEETVEWVRQRFLNFFSDFRSLFHCRSPLYL